MRDSRSRSDRGRSSSRSRDYGRDRGRDSRRGGRDYGRGSADRGRSASRGGRDSRRGGGTSYRRGEYETVNVGLIILTAVMGLIAGIVGNVVYNLFELDMPMMVIIGIAFAILAALTGIVVHISSVMSNNYEEPLIPFPDIPGAGIILIVIGVVITLVLGSVFQWIYGLNAQQQVRVPTSYIFVIDDSGSTDSSDPNDLRYSAIPEVLSTVDDDFPYMVYSFSSGASIIREMAPASANVPMNIDMMKGGTQIRGALNQVIDDYQTGVWTGGDCPKVILLTDGYAEDCYINALLNKTLKNYIKEGISISTVGLGDVDQSLMEMIAYTTGGTFISVEDAENLSYALSQASIGTNVDRDLLTIRPPSKNDVLYAILRIVFVAILGVLIGGLACVCYGKYDTMKLTLIAAAIKGVAAGIILELCTNVLGMSGRLPWIIAFIVIAATITTKTASVGGRNMGGASVRR